MCSAHCFIVLYNGVKFRENISNSIRVMEWTRNYEALTDGLRNTENFGWYNIIPCHFLWRGIKNEKICSLSIQNQISTILMHIPSLVKIHWYLLRSLSGNKNMDRWMYDRQMNGKMKTKTTNVIPSYPTTILWQGIKVIVGKWKHGQKETDVRTNRCDGQPTWYHATILWWGIKRLFASDR